MLRIENSEVSFFFSFENSEVSLFFGLILLSRSFTQLEVSKNEHNQLVERARKLEEDLTALRYCFHVFYIMFFTFYLVFWKSYIYFSCVHVISSLH
jgi:hypothetical protein